MNNVGDLKIKKKDYGIEDIDLEHDKNFNSNIAVLEEE